LAEVLEKPTVPLGDINYLSVEEKEELLTTLNTNTLAYPKEETLVSLFTKQAAQTPDANAIVYNDTALTYSELDELSNQLAHCLIKEHNVKLNDLVAVKLDRSEQFLVTILGILKAGAAYIPIDTNYPQERKEFILNDADVQLLITDSNYIFDLDYYEGNLFAIDIDFEAAQFETTLPNVEINAEDVAYIIYTSGSTGTPKGVMIQHQGIVNTAMAIIHGMDLASCKHSLQFASYSFDASVFEIYNALLSGSTLYMVDENTRKTPELLEKYILENRIETATLPPSFLKLMRMESLQHLKVLITAGEAAVYDKVMEYLEFGGVFYNAYGPTETSICSCAFKMTKETKVNGTQIPIGTTIANVQMYVVDDNHNLQPKGVVGELCISGSGLAKGYLNRDELTQEKFIQHPFVTGERLYKTGDMGRILDDGNIEFVGRVDDQVKIRGHRIELGEIAYQLETKEEIEEVALLVVDAESGDKELIAYLVATQEISTIEIRQYLAKRVPDYMLPNQFVQIEHIPLNTSRKVDKKALAALNTNHVAKEVAYVAPRNEIEEKVHDIWSPILNIEKISVKADFFALGGQSLKATSLINEYQKAFDVKLTLKELFENITLEAHANLITSTGKTNFKNIPNIPIAENYQVSDAQRRLWVQSQFEDASIAYNIPLSIRTEITDVESFEKAIHAVIKRHEILRTVFRKNQVGELRQWILTPEELNLSVDYQDFRDEEDKEKAVKAYIAANAHIAFNLEKGPLFKLSLLQIGAQEFEFYYNMHHIISDGWSMEVLAKDVLAYYEHYKNGTEVLLPALRIQYKDYAVWQSQQLESDAYQTHKDYWISKLGHAIQALALPTNKKRPKIKTYNGKGVRTFLAPELLQTMQQFLEKNGGSMFMLLLSELKVLIHHYTKSSDVIIGTPVAGRDHSDLEDQIGFYINTIALRSAIDGTNDFNTFYEQVKQDTIAAFEHQQYPFDHLVQDLNIPHDTSRSAIFDIILNLQNINTEISDEILTDIDPNAFMLLGDRMTKFDLTINFEAHGDHMFFEVEYNSDVYELEMIQQFMKHFKLILEATLQTPDSTINEVPYLSIQEKHQLLSVVNDTEVSLPENTTVLDLFKEQVAANPEKIALHGEDANYSFAELDTLSNKMAQCLREEHAINSESIVALKLDRNEWYVIAALAVLKAGATFLPIDIKTPAEREQYILEDADAVLLICSSDFMFDTSFTGNIFVIDIEFDVAQYENVAVNHIASWEQNAYIIYTSGSTGKPKGTVIGHKSLTNYLLWSKETYVENSSDNSFGLFTSIAFDLTITSTFLPLISGGSLTTYSASHDITTVLKSYSENGHSHIKLTPAHITVLQSLDLESEQLKVAIVGGDALQASHVETLQKINPAISIYNEYGPTEATVGCVVYKVDSATNILIGKPIQNTQVYVLDENNQLVADGVSGELHISGLGLAKGYLNNKALTEAKFIQHPFKEGKKLYKTGDLVKWINGEHLHFMGRTDHQVKIRGHRVELGEIAQQIGAKDTIQEVAVLIKDETVAEKELVAYITSTVEETSTNIRGFLATRVPDYMIPSAFIQIENFPLTINGKIDTKKLPSIEGTLLESHTVYVAASTETEEKLVSIWEEVLDAERVGIQDNFFTLGGNSIKAIKLLTLINKTFAIDINITDVFNDTTIENIAIKIEFIKGQEKLKDAKEMYKEIKL
ncbi:MAG: amino acid adenylation domain-containing protein, partial [Bacteroidota bacterium]